VNSARDRSKIDVGGRWKVVNHFGNASRGDRNLRRLAHGLRFDDPELNNPRYHVGRLLHDMAKLARGAAISNSPTWSQERKGLSWLKIVNG
jgi:hypothetical protein